VVANWDANCRRAWRKLPDLGSSSPHDAAPSLNDGNEKIRGLDRSSPNGGNGTDLPLLRRLRDGAIAGSAAAASPMARFETRWLNRPENLAALADLPGQWIDRSTNSDRDLGGSAGRSGFAKAVIAAMRNADIDA
jgi:hypothetical protein